MWIHIIFGCNSAKSSVVVLCNMLCIEANTFNRDRKDKVVMLHLVFKGLHTQIISNH